MPAFDGVAGGAEVDKEKRSPEEIASNVTSTLLMLIVAFFVGLSLWIGVFAIPAFFVFFRASVVTVSSIREVRVSLLLWFNGLESNQGEGCGLPVYLFGVRSRGVLVLDAEYICVFGEGVYACLLSGKKFSRTSRCEPAVMALWLLLCMRAGN